ncbi:MAG TPA: molybdopterin-dependent oxidoreductase [Gemmatimonadota bacterium]|nr:molybdopterin-dependent oxidoreductase [Gemmatimonadota bacterium]
MRRNVGTEKDTAYGGGRRTPGDLASILPPGIPLSAEREPEEVPSERGKEPRTIEPGLAPTPAQEVDAGELLTVTIEGVEVRVPKGATIFQAAEKAGYTPPHFCFHRDLSIPANCRMCLCEVKDQGKLQTSCSVAAADGMVVSFDSPRVKEAVQGVLEFEFKNHPLDCPVCDQVGECYLQKYYLEVGKYEPAPIERVHKDKVKDLGPITLDAERCVLCTRCVRFGEEISGTADFVIAHRSDHSEIMTFDDRPIDTAYALNYTDICPVGALTSNDFRFRKRVYYLRSAKSVCPECSTGCNIYAEQSEDELYRYRPRHNDDVNDSWMCDPGRLSYDRQADVSDRLAEPLAREQGALAPVSWDEAIGRAAVRLEELSGGVAAIAHPRMPNEDLWELARLIRTVGGGAIDFRADDSWKGVDELIDGILIRRDPNPNTRGAMAVLGLDGESRVPQILAAAAAGETRGLIVCGWSAEELGERGAKAIAAAEWILFVGPRRNSLADQADLVLPDCVHVERHGTFTNHAGRVQRFWPSVPPHESSRPAWSALAAITAALSGEPAPGTAEASFRSLAGAVGSFAGLSYPQLGDQGAWVAGRENGGMPPVGADPKPGLRAPKIL